MALNRGGGGKPSPTRFIESFNALLRGLTA